VTRQARPVEELQQAFFYSHTVPTQEMALSVGNPARLALSVKLPGDKKVLELPPGGKAVVTITAKRHAPAPAEEQTERKGAKPKPAPKDAGRIDIALAPSAPLPPEASKADPKRSSSPQVPAAFQIDAASMAPDQDQVQIKITAGKTAKPGVVHYLFLSGTMKISATDKFTRFAPAIPVRVLGSESPELGAK
jgi:hypothetical protein